MCGIAGIIGNSQATRNIKAMTDALRHRGPDAGGVEQFLSGEAAFGHRRLSILDLTDAGAQPMVDHDAGLVLSYNGEIYNFRELRQVLAAKGFSFVGHGDTEVLLRAYQYWGQDAVQHLEGMFAFAVADLKRRQVVLVRDRCGQKPLYYTASSSGFAFASEIKSLLRSGLTNRRLSEEGLDSYLAYGYTLGPETLVDGVQKVLPGEMLVVGVDDLQVSKWRYWEVPEAHEPLCDLDEAAEQLEKLLEGSVRRHLVADVPVGILLSGGLDSSLITAMAAKVSGSPVNTFTMVFPGHGRYDESGYARLVAEHFGARHHRLEMEQAGPEILSELAYQFDDPIADHAIVPTFLISKRIREVATVALGGDGGDELFGGYPHYGWVARQSQLRKALPAPLRSVVAGLAGRLPPGTTGRNHGIGLGGDIANAIAHFNLYFDRGLRAKLLGSSAECIPAEARKAQPLRSRESLVRQALWSDFKTTMPEGYLAKVDRASMLTSLEVRTPFLDDRIVDFSWSRVPVDMKVRGKVGKRLPRRLAARLLPKALDTQRKQGFTMPLGRWMGGSWGSYMEEVLFDPGQCLFDQNLLNALFRLQRRGYNNQNRLFALTMLSLWQRAHGITS